MPQHIRGLSLCFIVALISLLAKAQVSVAISLLNEKEDTYDSQIHLLSQSQQVVGHINIKPNLPVLSITTDPLTGQSYVHYSKAFDTAELRSTLDGSLLYRLTWDPLHTTYSESGYPGVSLQSTALGDIALELAGDYSLTIAQGDATSGMDFSLGVLDTSRVTPLSLDNALAIINNATNVMSWSGGVNTPTYTLGMLYSQNVMLSDYWSNNMGTSAPKSMVLPQPAYVPGDFTFFGAIECLTFSSQDVPQSIHINGSSNIAQSIYVEEISYHKVYVEAAPSVTAVPEPSTYGCLSVAGLLGLGAWRKRRRHVPRLFA